MATSGPSQPSPSIQVDKQDCDADLKSRVVRVTMRGFRCCRKHLRRRCYVSVAAGSKENRCVLTFGSSRNVVSVVPDGVNGCTHTFFLAFPSSTMAEAHMEGWKEGDGWELKPVTDEQLEVFVACAESMIMAVRDGVQVPETGGTSRTVVSTSTWEPRGLTVFHLQVERHAPAPFHV